MTEQHTTALEHLLKKKPPLVVVLDGLNEVRAGIKEILKDPQYNGVGIFLDSNFKAMITRLEFLTGTTPSVTMATQFPPVTNFMGEEITLPKPIVAEDLTPDQYETEQFLAKVSYLYNTIDTIPADGVLNTYALPEDQLVVRGVAKKAGVEGYAEREINVSFIEDIVKAIQNKNAKALQEKQIEAELAKQNKIAELAPKLTDAKAAGVQLANQLTDAEEALSKAKTAPQTEKAQVRVENLKSQIDGNLEVQLKLEDEINKLKGDAGTGQ